MSVGGGEYASVQFIEHRLNAQRVYGMRRMGCECYQSGGDAPFGVGKERVAEICNCALQLFWTWRAAQVAEEILYAKQDNVDATVARECTLTVQ